jgi:hypothetical protein
MELPSTLDNGHPELAYRTQKCSTTLDLQPHYGVTWRLSDQCWALPPPLATTILTYNGLRPEQLLDHGTVPCPVSTNSAPNLRPLLSLLASRGKVVRNYCLPEGVLDFSRSLRLQAIVDCVRQCKPRWPRCLRDPRQRQRFLSSTE